MKKLWIITLSLALLSLSLFMAGCDIFHKHIIVIDDAKDATCTEAGLTEGEHCSACEKILVVQEVVPARGHIEIVDAMQAPTCTKTGLTEGKHCSACEKVLVAQEVVPAKGHVGIVDAMQAPTCTEAGLTEGMHCSVCEKVIVIQEVIPAKGHVGIDAEIKASTCTRGGVIEEQCCSECHATVHPRQVLSAEGHKFNAENGGKCEACGKDLFACLAGDYGYTYLGGLRNGATLQKLYKMMDDAVRRFHFNYSARVDPSDSNAGGYCFATLEYGLLGLSSNEASDVWNAYVRDNSQYYWLADWWMWKSQGGGAQLHLYVENEYISGKVREEKNIMIAKVFNGLARDGVSDYDIALYLHDTIIRNMYYSYARDGRSPNDANWAHNILGYFDYGAGVCESYARVFQVFLNYYGVDNIYVNGDSTGGQHVWNMVKLDNDWYWFDLTWDDAAFGVSYDYFCIARDESVSKYVNALFTDSHTAFTPPRQYRLPAASSTPYALKKVG